ncbi:MAG TPA: prephenate dehydrogenase [Dehalococcoidia bacterium]|jgi:prephenate dehydrogenase|nr:prephenate dehydrogenase [Dehalococcoidia bacterium]
MPRIAIIGTGLIGASIGLRMREQSGITDLEIVGSDDSSGHLKRAEKIGAIDCGMRNPREAVQNASLVVLATPVLSMRRLMTDIAPALTSGAIVTDTGSTKAEVLTWAKSELPRTVSFIGGHPMAGKTESGPAFADASLFEDARWAIVPMANASEGSLKTIRNLVETMGATPMFMDAEEHDAYVAAISHLPLMAATALFTMVHESEAWPELSELAAGGFKDMTRLTGTEPNVAFDIAITNRTQIIHWIERYREALLGLQERLSDKDGEEEFFRYIAEAHWDYTGYRAGNVGRQEIDEKMAPIPRTEIANLFMGEALASKMRDLTAASDARVEELERKARVTRRE